MPGVDVFDDSIDFVAEVFKPGGLMAQHFEAYEPRTGQVEMAYAVTDGMRQGHNVVGEAPTGTGKSIAYGVPASYFAARGEKVVIVTANIALQEQLIRKDLPTLARVLPWQFTFALAKGLSNYLCLDQFDESVKETLLMDTGSPRDRELWPQVVRWAGATTTGDVSELPFETPGTLRSRFTTTPEDCLGLKCPYRDQCHGIRARGEARRASVVVTNYHLFFADLQIKRAGGEGVLPRYRHVVMDEGHVAADIARDFMGFRISRGSITWAARLLDAKADAKAKKGPLPVIDAEQKRELVRAADNLFGVLNQVFHSREYSVRFLRPWGGEVEVAGRCAVNALQRAARIYSEFAREGGLTPERTQELQQAAARCAALADNLTSVMEYTANDWVYFLDEEGDHVVLKGKPISVAEYLRESVFEAKTGEHAVKSCTVTSATLTTERDDFTYVARQLGVKSAEFITVASPFDLEHNMLIVTPPMPEPQSDRFIPAAAERLLEILGESQGRALCLFTSYRVMNAVFERVAPQLPYTALKHGQAPRLQLIERFKADRSSVLFGTESFWAGVDVPGDALSVVVIDRLPFPNVGDPLQDVLKARLARRYFPEVSVPAAVIAFRQGCGRLIRTTTDRGAVVVLDSRVVEKGYGRSFLRSFPRGVRHVRDIGAIGPFLAV